MRLSYDLMGDLLQVKWVRERHRSVSTDTADARAGHGAVTAKGRAVVFSSGATDLVPGDTNGVPDVFVQHAR